MTKISLLPSTPKLTQASQFPMVQDGRTLSTSLAEISRAQGLTLDYSAGFTTHHLTGADGSAGYATDYGSFVATFDGGADVPAGIRLDRVVQNLSVGAGATHVRLKLSMRPATSEAVNLPPSVLTDLVHLDTVELPLGVAALDPAHPLMAGSAARVAVAFGLTHPIFVDAAMVYIMEFDTFDADRAIVAIGVARGAVEPSASQRHRGWFKTSPAATNYTNIGSSAQTVYWRADGRLSFSATDNATRVDAASSDAAAALVKANSVVDALTVEKEAGAVASNSVYPISSFKRWLWAADVGSDLVLQVGDIWVGFDIPGVLIGSEAASLELTLYARPLTNSLDVTAPASGDTTYGPYLFNVADLGLTPGSTTPRNISLRLPTGIPKAHLDGMSLFRRIICRDATGVAATNAQIGLARLAGISNDDVALRQRGWYSTALPTGPSWQVISGSRMAFTDYVSRIDTGGEAAVEVAASRGDRPTLADRLSQTLDPYGSPRRSFNAHALRQYHWRRSALTRPEPDLIKNVIALFGTSWTQNPLRYSGGLARKLYQEQGQGGVGWVGFGWASGATGNWNSGTQPGSKNGNVLRDDYPVTFMGPWTSPGYGDHPTPDTAIAESSTAGNDLRVSVPASPALSGATLYWEATADGVVEYSWDSTTWTSLNVQGATVGDCYWANLANPPIGSALLRIRVASGTVRLGGVNLKSAASGAVVHKLAVGGKGAQQLRAQAVKPSWRAAIASLGINTAIVMHGTNDQGSSGFEANMATIATSLRSAIPATDILLVMEAENARTTNPRSMAQMALGVARVAAENDYGFYDLQLDFGLASNPTFYQAVENGGTLPLFNAADLFHPEPVTGGRLIEAGMLRFMHGEMK